MAKLTRQQVIEKVKKGESLAEENLSGLDLSAAALSKVVDLMRVIPFVAFLFKKSTLRTMGDLSDANLFKADLSGAKLSGAWLLRANLCEANLRKANLTGTDLRGADLTKADLSRAKLIGANLSMAKLIRANLSRARLCRADISKASLYEVNLVGADLLKANLSGADLSWANLIEADLTKANLSGANLSRVNLFEANLIEADLTKANLSRAKLIGANLSGVNLSEANLRWANFTSAKLVEANLQRADLRKSQFPDTNLSGANLTGAKLYGIWIITDTKLDNIICEWYDYSRDGDGSDIRYPGKHGFEDIVQTLEPQITVTSDARLDHDLLAGLSGLAKAMQALKSKVSKVESTPYGGSTITLKTDEEENLIPAGIVLFNALVKDGAIDLEALSRDMADLNRIVINDRPLIALLKDTLWLIDTSQLHYGLLEKFRKGFTSMKADIRGESVTIKRQGEKLHIDYRPPAERLQIEDKSGDTAKELVKELGKGTTIAAIIELFKYLAAHWPF